MEHEKQVRVGGKEVLQHLSGSHVKISLLMFHVNQRTNENGQQLIVFFPMYVFFEECEII